MSYKHPYTPIAKRSNKMPEHKLLGNDSTKHLRPNQVWKSILWTLQEYTETNPYNIRNNNKFHLVLYNNNDNIENLPTFLPHIQIQNKQINNPNYKFNSHL